MALFQRVKETPKELDEALVHKIMDKLEQRRMKKLKVNAKIIQASLQSEEALGWSGQSKEVIDPYREMPISLPGFNDAPFKSDHTFSGVSLLKNNAGLLTDRGSQSLVSPYTSQVTLKKPITL